MQTLLKRRFGLALAALVVLLLCKYFWSMTQFPGVPFGYDAGIYRYLFLRHASGIPPLDTASLPDWAQVHAPGLFLFASLLMKAGVPVDWLIGWVWNLVPVVLACVLAAVYARKEGMLIGLLVLGMALVSVGQYEGFLLMYYKVYIALIWCVLAFYALERGSLSWIFFGMMTVATHQQIGLIFALSTLAAICSGLTWRGAKRVFRSFVRWCITLVLGLLWYVPTYHRSLGDQLPHLLEPMSLIALATGVVLLVCIPYLLFRVPVRHKRSFWIGCGVLLGVALLVTPFVIDAPAFVHKLLEPRSDQTAGVFLSITDYLWTSLPLLLLGITGLLRSVQFHRGTPWQWAVVVSGIAAFSMMFFYRRFLLPFDFFLLPFAALACKALWQQKTTAAHGTVILLVVLQGVLLVDHMGKIDPHVPRSQLQEFSTLHTSVPDGSNLVVLDIMTPWVLGYLPNSSVAGPGIFLSLPLPEWEKFLLGSSEDRKRFFWLYPKNTYFYATDVFFSYYPPDVTSVLKHSCLKPVGPKGLYRSSCGN